MLDTEFADDTALYVDGEEQNLHNVQCVVQEFCELSGAIINWNKSIGIRMKNNGVSHWLPHPDFQRGIYERGVNPIYNIEQNLTFSSSHTIHIPLHGSILCKFIDDLNV